jgi:hypothetical protein
LVSLLFCFVGQNVSHSDERLIKIVSKEI